MKDTYGHEPIDEYAGTPEAERGATHLVCARCVSWTHWADVDLMMGSRVSWPCNSATALGVDRDIT